MAGQWHSQYLYLLSLTPKFKLLTTVNCAPTMLAFLLEVFHFNSEHTKWFQEALIDSINVTILSSKSSFADNINLLTHPNAIDHSNLVISSALR